jgi:hypothetical protein
MARELVVICWSTTEAPLTLSRGCLEATQKAPVAAELTLDEMDE